MEEGTREAAGLADEGDWLELLVASERIHTWLDTMRKGSRQQQKQALQQLKAEIESREAYAEEARMAGAIQALTQMIAKTDDDELCTLASAVISACTGNMHSKTREISFGGHSLWIQEGALSDGLGTRIWASASILCRELVREPGIVRGKQVLELGSGCGLCGILASKLGAAQVVLSDCEEQVLLNLHKCVAGNLEPGAGCSRIPTAPHPSGMSKDAAGGCAQIPMWDMENVRIRFLDWSTALSSEEAARLRIEDPCVSQNAVRGAGFAPLLDTEERFPVIIGSDLMYEASHATLLGAVIAQRLDAGGSAVLALAVRRQEHLKRLTEELQQRQMQVHVQRIQPRAEDFGIAGREHEYEGGFVLVTLQHT